MTSRTRWSRREVLGGMLGAGLLTTAAACGSPGKRLGPAGTGTRNQRYMMAYNAFGNVNGPAPRTNYSIGLATSPDAITWLHRPEPVLTSIEGASWETGGVKNPCLVLASSQYHLYYAGYPSTGPAFSIGLATARLSALPTFTRTSSSPVLSAGRNGAWDANLTGVVSVVYDIDDANPTRRWKMWYSGYSTALVKEDLAIGYAYSSDGVEWVKSSFNPVITVPDMPNVVRWEGTWYMVGGKNAYTFTNPEGPYTQIMMEPFPVSSAVETLTSPAAEGASAFYVSDTSAFNVGEPVLLLSANRYVQQTMVKSIPSTKEIVIEDVAAYDYTASDSIRSLYFNFTNPNSAIYIDGTWVNFGTAYQQFESHTTVASGSDGMPVSSFTGSGVLYVESTTGFPSSGTLPDVYTNTGIATITYRGVTSGTTPSLTGCTTTYGAGDLATGLVVTGPQLFLCERAVAFTAPSLSSPWTFDYRRGGYLRLGGSRKVGNGWTADMTKYNEWNSNSSENPSVVFNHF